jgi:hypothetical protein
MRLLIRLLILTGGLPFLALGCGGSSSSSSVTAPSTVRCAVALSADTPMIAASGANGTMSVSVNRECTWQARSEADWISLASPATGQGPATLTYVVAENPDASTRRGSISVNEQRLEISQAAAACRFALDGTSHAFGASGGSHVVVITAQAGCSWSARSDVAWVTITSGGAGNGPGSVSMAVAPNTGAARVATLTIAGETYSVIQAAVGQGAPTPAPPTTPAPAPAPPPPGASCAYSVRPDAHTLGPDGGTGAVLIETGPSCPWSAVSSAGWLTITSVAGGTGQATLTFRVQQNSGAPRTATLNVAGQIVTVTQAQPQAPAPPAPAPPAPAPPAPAPPPSPGPSCSFSLAPMSLSVGFAAATESVSVTAAGGCSWTASSQADWIGITSGSSGSGNGTVQFTIAQNPGTSPRTGTLTIAGQTVTVVQAAPPPPAPAPAPQCAFTLSTTTDSVGASAATRQLQVTASAAGCAWTATSQADWIAITRGASGTGSDQVRFTVAANPSQTPRTGTLTIAGQTVTVTQAGQPPPQCTYALSRTDVPAGPNGGEETVQVSTTSQCAWTATSQADWITITRGASGTGSDQVRFTVAANPSQTPRTGTLTIAGQTVTVTQQGVAAVQLSGRVADLSGSCPVLTFRLDGQTVRTDAGTEFRNACHQVRDGRRVTVTGTLQQDGSVLANLVNMTGEDQEDDGSGG